MRKRTRISALGEILGGGLPGRLAGRLPSPALVEAWRELTGPTVSAKAWPVCLEAEGLLVVAVAGSLWRQELTLQTPALLQGLARRGQAVSALKLVAAATPAPPPPAPPPAPPVDQAEELAIGQLLANVSDPDLRRALDSLLRAQIQAQKAQG